MMSYPTRAPTSRSTTSHDNRRGQDMRSVTLGRNDVTRLLDGVTVGFAICADFVVWPARAPAQDLLRAALYPVGMTQLEYVDRSEGGRPLNLMLIYPAAPTTTAVPFNVFLATNLHLHKDAPIAPDGVKRPLVMFSHGAGGNGSAY